jgi:multiple sugar transport system substrate-binding protein
MAHFVRRATAAALSAASLTFITVGAVSTLPAGSAGALPLPQVAIATQLTAASCPGGVVTLTAEDQYGAPSTSYEFPGLLAQFYATYSKAHPCVKVVRKAPVYSGDSNYVSTVLSQISANSAPDLVEIDNADLPAFAADNVLAPLASLGNISTITSEINPANLAETTYAGQLWALPLYTNTLGIFYNKTLLAQNGITTLPTTWAQFGADAKKTAHGKDLGFVFSGQAGPGQAAWQFYPWGWTEGGTTAHPDVPGEVAALAFLASLVKEGAAPTDVVNWGQQQPFQAFEAGQAAFCETGLWYIPGLQQSFKKLNWGVMQFPTQVAGQTVIAPFGGETWAIPKNIPTADKTAAFALLQAMGNPKEIKQLAILSLGLPTVPSLWNQPPWNIPVYQPFLTELKHARGRATGLKDPANYDAIDQDLGLAIEAALLGKESAATALATAQTQIDQLSK